MADDKTPFEDDTDLEDLGAPIEELRTLEELPSSGSLSRLLNGLRRRDLNSQLVILSWSGLGTVALEFIRVVFSVFDSSPPDRGDSD